MCRRTWCHPASSITGSLGFASRQRGFAEGNEKAASTAWASRYMGQARRTASIGIFQPTRSILLTSAKISNKKGSEAAMEGHIIERAERSGNSTFAEVDTTCGVQAAGATCKVQPREAVLHPSGSVRRAEGVEKQSKKVAKTSLLHLQIHVSGFLLKFLRRLSQNCQKTPLTSNSRSLESGTTGNPKELAVPVVQTKESVCACMDCLVWQLA
jgi:hypothetical protein